MESKLAQSLHLFERKMLISQTVRFGCRDCSLCHYWPWTKRIVQLMRDARLLCTLDIISSILCQLFMYLSTSFITLLL